MFPIGDDTGGGRVPLAPITIGIIILNAVVFLFQLTLGAGI